MMTFVVGLTQFMTPSGHWLTTGQLDLLKRNKKNNWKIKNEKQNKIKKKIEEKKLKNKKKNWKKK